MYPTAVHLSGVSFFWTCALKIEHSPWGITANLLINRSCSMHNMICDSEHDIDNTDGDDDGDESYDSLSSNMKVRFDDAFIKTGGGGRYRLLFEVTQTTSEMRSKCCMSSSMVEQW